jgi:monooxygenase
MTATAIPARTLDPADAAPPADSVDVLIVGAGLSGIGAAFHLQQRCPSTTYAILEARNAIGGTWDLFRYPGVRSDSPMHTLGYSFRPWTHAEAITDGSSIRRYIADTAHDAGIDAHIRFGHRVARASWSTATARWTIEAVRGAGGSESTVRLCCRFLHVCGGYYSYESAYRPRFENEAMFTGRIIHPQFWPEQLDFAGKQVIVIGSGATAITLIPQLAKDAAHVTMLQRSPSYLFNRPREDAIANRLRRVLPQRLAWRLTRAKDVLVDMAIYQLARRRPELAKQKLIQLVREQLPPDFDVATHFTPRYNPWRQRVCLVADGDFFKAIKKGSVSVVTDEIEAFTAGGVRLKSGTDLAADIVVIATGLNLRLMGNIELTVDGARPDVSKAMTYKSAMLSGVPNLTFTFGYTNASWTLKADLTATFACRLIRHMNARGYSIAVPRRDPQVCAEPFLDFTSGYVTRALDLLPRQGSERPWRVYQNYLLDLFTLRFSRIDDGVLKFSRDAA